MENRKLSFGQYITTARIRGFLTLEQFAKRFQIPKQSLQRIETGAVPKPKNLKRLEAAIVALGFDKKEFYRLYEEAYKQRRAEHAEAKTL